jgi:hypothetical protein
MYTIFVEVISCCTGSHDITKKSREELFLIIEFFEMDELSKTYYNGLR